MMFEGTAGIKLFLDADLYQLKEKIAPNTLTPPKELPKETLFAETPTIPNARTSVKLIILVENGAKTSKSAKEIEFLTKLVNAVGIHMKDVAILSVTEATSVEAKKALLFYSSTESASKLSIFESYNQELKKYEPFTVYNQQILWADSIDQLIDAVDLKKALWAGLKKMYGLG